MPDAIKTIFSIEDSLEKKIKIKSLEEMNYTCDYTSIKREKFIEICEEIHPHVKRMIKKYYERISFLEDKKEYDIQNKIYDKCLKKYSEFKKIKRTIDSLMELSKKNFENSVYLIRKNKDEIPELKLVKKENYKKYLNSKQSLSNLFI